MWQKILATDLGRDYAGINHASNKHFNMNENENDITPQELTAAIEDEALRTWWEGITFPPEFSINEFLVKALEAASIAAAQKNETLDAGQKITGYPRATNGAIAYTSANQLFFPRTSTVVSRVMVTLDMATPAIG